MYTFNNDLNNKEMLIFRLLLYKKDPNLFEEIFDEYYLSLNIS